MESFRISALLDNTDQEVLVIPDDCADKSIFHLVKNGTEFCKLVYTDTKSWELVENADVAPIEIEELGKKIEEHYFQ